MKAFALGPALLVPATLLRLAQASTLATSATATPSPDAPATAGATGPAVVVRQMMVRPLPTPGNLVAATVVVEYAPGAASPPHRHPGPVFGYVLQGKVRIGVGKRPPITYAEGDFWYEAPRHVHRVAANASATEPAKILAFLILRKGEPILEALRASA